MKALIISICVAIVAFIGFFIYQHNRATTVVEPLPTASQQNSPASASDYVSPIATTSGTSSQSIIWSSEAQQTLCWDGSQNCTPGRGEIDINGDKSLLLGAVEYCQYLNSDGRTVDKTPQNHWRLPTINELIAQFKNDPASFHYSSYWSITSGSNLQATYLSIDKNIKPLGYAAMSSGKYNGSSWGHVLCIKP